VIPRRRIRILLIAVVVFVAAVLWRHAKSPRVPQMTMAPAASASSNSGEECQTMVGYRAMQIGNRTVAVWYPTTAQASEYHYSPKFSATLAKDAPVTTACGGRVPLVVFSHGYTGCGLQSVTFTEELARNGYVVAAPDHADAAICHTAPPAQAAKHSFPSQPKIVDPGAWNDTVHADRRDDVEAVIDALLKNNEFGPVIDPQKIGLAGHSLGGYTVVGMAGGWQSWLDPRVRAVLAMSPYVMPFQVKNTLGNVHVPLMYQGGTLDVGITPFLQGPKGAYKAANPPVYFVDLRGAGHLAWTNCGSEHTTESCLAHVTDARLIAQYGIAFFNRHLKGLPEPVLDRKDPALAEYNFELQR
jgi:predicted dienelactone hydrolase